jgi:hypothetical protein
MLATRPVPQKPCIRFELCLGSLLSFSSTLGNVDHMITMDQGVLVQQLLLPRLAHMPRSHLQSSADSAERTCQEHEIAIPTAYEVMLLCIVLPMQISGINSFRMTAASWNFPICLAKFRRTAWAISTTLTLAWDSDPRRSSPV